MKDETALSWEFILNMKDILWTDKLIMNMYVSKKNKKTLIRDGWGLNSAWYKIHI